MSQHREFVALAQQARANRRALCRSFRISPTTGYRWLAEPLPPEQAPRQSWHRFERPAPNELWQLDFKGHFPLLQGGRCHPLTLLDDHSRFYLLRLGVRIIHGRPYHPQTQGKTEVLRDRTFLDLATYQRHLTAWRTVYHCERPHEALGDWRHGQSLPSESAPLPRGAAADRVYPRDRGAAGASQGRDCPARPDLPCRTRLSRLSRGGAADIGAAPGHGAVLPRNHR